MGNRNIKFTMTLTEDQIWLIIQKAYNNSQNIDKFMNEVFGLSENGNSKEDNDLEIIRRKFYKVIKKATRI